MSANLMSLARSGGKFLKLYGDRKMVWSLPYLRRVAWLQNLGFQNIDTGIKSNEIDSFEIDVVVPNISSWGRVLGSYNSTNTLFTPGNNPSSGQISLNSSLYSDFTFDFKNRHKYRFLKRDGLLIEWLDGEFVNSISADNKTDYNYLCLFSGKTTTHPRIFGFRCYYNDVILCDLIPVLDISGRPAMYDEVRGQFFYNQGSGEFTWGELDSQTT